MKALITDLAKTATVSALHETLTYPPINVIDTFLDLPFVSVLDTDTLTVDLGSDKVLDSVFIAGCNATSVTVLIRNAALSTVYNQVKPIPNASNGIYPGTVTGRYISITGTAVGSTYFKIKKVSVGVVEDFGEVIAGFGLPTRNATSIARSATGQTIANMAPSLRAREITIPVLRKDGGRARAQEIINILSSLGPGQPIFWDITAEDQEYEETIYAIMEGDLDPTDNGTHYRIPITLLEAR